MTAPDPEARAAAEAALAEAGVHLRLLRLVAGDHGRALEAVPDLPPAEQEFWQHSVWALSAMLDERSIPDPADRATQAVASLRTAATKLSGEAKLTLRNVNFCHRVDSFGNAVPVRPGRVHPQPAGVDLRGGRELHQPSRTSTAGFARRPAARCRSSRPAASG